MKKINITTFIQPTGKLHLGNYFGAIQNFSYYLNKKNYNCLIGIANLHSLTNFFEKNKKYNKNDLYNKYLDCIAQYIACGISPNKANIFLQSSVSYHTYLAWILSCITPLGNIKRMTQFKEKSSNNEVKNSGILYYPILQAADILLYNTNIVPVGEDQKQHIELARDIACKFNDYYPNTFFIPEIQTVQGLHRIMSLKNPNIKMSKSDNNPDSTIYLSDSDEKIIKKIMSAVTDSDNKILKHPDKPGISNLLIIMSLITNKKINELEEYFKNSSYFFFKKTLAESLIKMLKPIKINYKKNLQNKDNLKKILEIGNEKANIIALKNINKIIKKIGLKI